MRNQTETNIELWSEENYTAASLRPKAAVCCSSVGEMKLQKKDRKGICLLMQEAGTQRVTSLCTKSLQKTLTEFLLLWAL